MAFAPFLVDGDTITETTCVRQPFARSEIGLYKAVVLINRLNLFWGVDWEAVPHFVKSGQDLPDSDFLISCVDTRAARATLARIVSLKSRTFRYWLDAGNTSDRGQFVLGQPLRRDRKGREKRLPACMSYSPRVHQSRHRPRFLAAPVNPSIWARMRKAAEKERRRLK